MIKLRPKCSMLVEQDKFLKDVSGELIPLGHCCYNDAEYSDGVYFFCKECRNKIIAGDTKGLEYPAYNCVEAWGNITERINQ
jgi:hypothetical protein